MVVHTWMKPKPFGTLGHEREWIGPRTHNHSCAPCEGDTGKEISRAQLAYENSGRGLEDNVGHEEHQDNNRLAER
jgi:hypothetical protein